MWKARRLAQKHRYKIMQPSILSISVSTRQSQTHQRTLLQFFVLNVTLRMSQKHIWKMRKSNEMRLSESAVRNGPKTKPKHLLIEATVRTLRKWWLLESNIQEISLNSIRFKTTRIWQRFSKHLEKIYSATVLLIYMTFYKFIDLEIFNFDRC